MATYGVQVRVQRVTVEDAFVEVFIGEDMWVTRSDGKKGIDVEQLGPRAVQIASQAGVDWQVEHQEIKPHEIQIPMPENRVRSLLTDEDRR